MRKRGRESACHCLGLRNDLMVAFVCYCLEIRFDRISGKYSMRTPF